MFREVVDRDLCQVRLNQIFPRQAFDTSIQSPIAAAAVAVMIYINAVVPDLGDPPDDSFWARPTTVLWMTDAALEHTDETDRRQWREAAAKGQRKLRELRATWDDFGDPWYSDNSRETVRDETWPLWNRFGAVRTRPGVVTNSSKPRWALTESFAELFNPDLNDIILDEAIEAWVASHLTTHDRIRIGQANRQDRDLDSVAVMMPLTGIARKLSTGLASAIIKGVIEEWAPRRMDRPYVIAISEPGNKLFAPDQQILADAGISINVSELLPDLLMVDLSSGSRKFWIVEAVATDGVIDEARKEMLTEWAQDQKIPSDQCQFLSAFASRNSAPGRKRLKDLAAGTYAWYLDEPTHELAWYQVT